MFNPVQPARKTVIFNALCLQQNSGAPRPTETDALLDLQCDWLRQIQGDLEGGTNIRLGVFLQTC